MPSLMEPKPLKCILIYAFLYHFPAWPDTFLCTIYDTPTNKLYTTKVSRLTETQEKNESKKNQDRWHRNTEKSDKLGMQLDMQGQA